MPEGPEVLLSAELIRPLAVGKTVVAAYSTSNSRYGDSKNGSTELGEDYNRFIDVSKANPIIVQSVKVRGKFMYWTFNNNWSMFCTFGMSGQWSPQRGKHPCFVFEFSDGTSLYFNDPRHFGTVKFSRNLQALSDKLNELGWDPLADKLDNYLKFITATVQKSNKPIAQLLMDQSIFAGVGNYIKAEALYVSKISPWRVGKQLLRDEIKTLCEAIITVMEESYKFQGATIHTYKTVYGEEGKYSSCFKVYNQKQDPLGNQIITEETPDKRTTHWCPAIQK